MELLFKGGVEFMAGKSLATCGRKCIEILTMRVGEFYYGGIN